MRQMVAIPAAQCFITRVFKEKFQRWRFDVAVAKDRVGLNEGMKIAQPFMAGLRVPKR
jgi:hypothetical protein